MEMSTLSDNTKNMLKDNAISWRFNEETRKYELHFPSDNFEYLETENEIIESVKEYIEFWENN